MAQLKLAATGGAGGLVLRWLGTRNIGVGEILRCAPFLRQGRQNDGVTKKAKGDSEWLA